MNDVCWKLKKKNPCKNTCSPWWEPDEVWCAQWKRTHLPSSGMKKTVEEKWSVSNKRWKRQEVVRCSRQSPCQRRWCWYKEGSAGGGTEKWEAGEDWGGPNTEGVCVRRISKLKDTKHAWRHGRGRKTVLHLVKHTLIIWRDPDKDKVEEISNRIHAIKITHRQRWHA